jgi:hypothetical protein
MDAETLKFANTALDIILVLASFWMIFSIRGVGGIVGRTLTLIVIGAVILGMAHLISTLTKGTLIPSDIDPMVHRIIVLVGFIFLVLGFRQLKAIQ